MIQILSYFAATSKQDLQTAFTAHVIGLFRGQGTKIEISTGRTVSDQKNRVYYYQDTNSPGVWLADERQLAHAASFRRPDYKLRRV